MGRIYISGDLTALNDKVIKHYNIAENDLRKAGNEVINPVNAFFNRLKGVERLKLAGVLLCSCTGIHFLEGWELSNESRAEYMIATALGINKSFEIACKLGDIEAVKNAVITAFRLNIGDLERRCRAELYSLARMAATHLFIKYYSLKSEQIATILHRDRATVIYYREKGYSELKYNKDYQSKLKRAEEILKHYVSGSVPTSVTK